MKRILSAIIGFIFVAMNGQATGPFDVNVLKQMSINGQFSVDSLVWKVGMAEWVKASTVEEMKVVFGGMPPMPRE